LSNCKKKTKNLEKSSILAPKNSSQPPSQDSNQKTTVKTLTGKKQGAQSGHRPAFRKLVPPEKVDRMVNVFPSLCSCGYKGFKQEDIIKTEALQQVDIPPIKAITTQYNIHTCLCGKCMKKCKAE
jgi:hypothetical protein